MGAAGRQSFIVGTSGGTASLVEIPAEALNAESARGKEGRSTDPGTSSLSPGQRCLPSDQTTAASNAGAHGSTAESGRGPSGGRAGRDPGGHTAYFSPV